MDDEGGPRFDVEGGKCPLGELTEICLVGDARTGASYNLPRLRLKRARNREIISHDDEFEGQTSRLGLFL